MGRRIRPAPRIRPRPRNNNNNTNTKRGAQMMRGGSYGNSGSSGMWQMQQSMTTMRADMSEMMMMMRSSLDLQQEMNRQIRQEVSAVLDSVRRAPAAHTHLREAAATASPNPRALGGACVVCADRKADMVFLRCGHVCACGVCARRCAHEGQPCPICRAPIQDFLQVYPV